MQCVLGLLYPVSDLEDIGPCLVETRKPPAEAFYLGVKVFVHEAQYAGRIWGCRN